MSATERENISAPVFRFGDRVRVRLRQEPGRIYHAVIRHISTRQGFPLEEVRGRCLVEVWVDGDVTPRTLYVAPGLDELLPLEEK